MRRFILFFFGFVTILSSQIQSKTKEACKECIQRHEKKIGIEPGLLEAIVQIESKHKPYAVNACGRAYSFSSASEAAQFVQSKQREGYQNISVGATQLHVPSHGRRFKDLTAMMDPEQNIAYAAKYLKKLRQQTGSWESAVKRYHSPDPTASARYCGKVFGAWAKIKKIRSKQNPQKHSSLKVAYKLSQENKKRVYDFLMDDFVNALIRMNEFKTKKTKVPALAKMLSVQKNQGYVGQSYYGPETIQAYQSASFQKTRKMHDLLRTASAT